MTEGESSELVDLKFNADALARYGLPDILYPLTMPAFEAAMASPGELPFADMLNGLQLRSREGSAHWQVLEPAQDRLAELMTPEDDRSVITAAGDNWWVEIGPVDLDQPIVTIQRRDQLMAAVCARPDGRLRLATYRPLDAKSAEYVIGLGLLPHPEFGVAMRESNWEYARDCAAGMGNFYAFQRGEAHLSYWDHGIGVSHDGSIHAHWRAMLDVAPLQPAMAAVQLGVHYTLGGA